MNDSLWLNRWVRANVSIENLYVRQLLAEMLSTYILIIFGLAGIAQYKFMFQDDEFQTNSLPANFAFGIGGALGILIAGNISGAHMNPAVSLAFIISGRMSPFQFLFYVFGQYIGAFAA
jgi:glycerol uptake facilitator-like aquaporin